MLITAVLLNLVCFTVESVFVVNFVGFIFYSVVQQMSSLWYCRTFASRVAYHIFLALSTQIMCVFFLLAYFIDHASVSSRHDIAYSVLNVPLNANQPTNQLPLSLECTVSLLSLFHAY